MKGREFLRNMVRRIVAALVSVADGTATLQDVQDVLNGKDFSFGLAPAKSLVLMHIDYGIEFKAECPITLERKTRAKRAEKMIELMFYDSLSEMCGEE